MVKRVQKKVKKAKKINDEGTSDLKSDEPTQAEKSFPAELQNEDDLEEEEDSEDKNVYGEKEGPGI